MNKLLSTLIISTMMLTAFSAVSPVQITEVKIEETAVNSATVTIKALGGSGTFQFTQGNTTNANGIFTNVAVPATSLVFKATDSKDSTNVSQVTLTLAAVPVNTVPRTYTFDLRPACNEDGAIDVKATVVSPTTVQATVVNTSTNVPLTGGTATPAPNFSQSFDSVKLTVPFRATIQTRQGSTGAFTNAAVLDFQLALFKDLVLKATSTPATSPTNNDGCITIEVTGGSGQYTASIGAGLAAKVPEVTEEESVSGPSPLTLCKLTGNKTFTVLVTDDKIDRGCEATVDVTVDVSPKQPNVLFQFLIAKYCRKL